MHREKDDSSIGQLIEQHRPGWTLQQEFYTSPLIFESDLDRIFMRDWLFAGHVSRIPKEGDYFLFNLGGESIIFIRGEHDQVHALFNVCRHRGSRLCLDESGSAKTLVCPYHAWVYDRDGRLLAARHMPADIDRCELGLHRGHVRVFEGLIFVSFAETPPGFDGVERDIGPFLAPHGFSSAKICRRLSYDVKANWKIIAENAWECYHCGPAHPEFATVMSYVGAIDSAARAEERRQFVAEWEAAAQRIGHMTGGFERTHERWYSCHRVPIRPGYLTQSQDGQPVGPVMGSLTRHDGGILGIMMYPLIWFVAASDHGMLFRMAPLDSQRTEVEITWIVKGDAEEGIDYDADRVSWLWRVTGEQDWRLCENNQNGINSRRYRPGPYAPQEGGCESFIQWYLSRLQAP